MMILKTDLLPDNVNPFSKLQFTMSSRGPRPAPRPAALPARQVAPAAAGIVGRSSFTVKADGYNVSASNVRWNGNSFSGTGTLNGISFSATGTANGNRLTGEPRAEFLPHPPFLRQCPVLFFSPRCGALCFHAHASPGKACNAMGCMNFSGNAQ
jgi:hypothetical protein